MSLSKSPATTFMPATSAGVDAALVALFDQLAAAVHEQAEGRFLVLRLADGLERR